MRKFLKKTAVSFMALTMAVMSIQLPSAHAAMVPTEAVVISQQSETDREKLVAFLDRAEVQQELQSHGVSADEAKIRVAQLNDEEVQMLAGKIDELPAGGLIGEVIGAAVFIFLVLLITDVLGLTSVFPFVNHHGR
ncbi:hypothetical protein Ga0123462_1781 [Mariprofundus ferrinatatus]|uniref:PA2779 family protein n=1 Tax=Mariprofundus ferrinatatus TaxID=1921087 RepID=A0A2K8L5N5_9PROT|nr:PA2779 family protein [Mariprofundus ferrinatatus]ATX82628.1 hypothetical protein Ga0123462_1781 [Mariprofundus ferrinatatus]